MSSPDLEVEVVRATDHVAVVLRGELDAHGEAEAHAALDEASAAGAGVVLDLRGLEFVDSSGLKLVLVWNRRLKERGVAFTVVRGAPHVQRPFTSAGLDDLLPFADGPPS